MWNNNDNNTPAHTPPPSSPQLTVRKQESAEDKLEGKLTVYNDKLDKKKLKEELTDNNDVYLPAAFKTSRDYLVSHVGKATQSFKNLLTWAQGNSTAATIRDKISETGKGVNIVLIETDDNHASHVQNIINGPDGLAPDANVTKEYIHYEAEENVTDTVTQLLQAIKSSLERQLESQNHIINISLNPAPGMFLSKKLNDKNDNYREEFTSLCQQETNELEHDKNYQTALTEYQLITKKLAQTNKNIVIAYGNNKTVYRDLDYCFYNPLTQSRHVISVTASGNNNTPLNYTDDGIWPLALNGNEAWPPTVAAHGHQVPLYDNNRTVFDADSGTSYSAPFVSAALALALEKNPHLSSQQLRTIIATTAHPIKKYPNTLQGAGVVDIIAVAQNHKAGP
ncbi:S8 family serine peptidase [bacterium]|nr:S8 family serine peptidase [bacterium]